MRLPAKKCSPLRAPDSPPYFDGDSQARLTEYGTVVKLPSFRSVPMYQERRCAQRYALVANAEVANSSDERIARVEDLCIAGACLAMTNPFSKHASVLIKIRTSTEFFQCHATVAHSTHGIGMGVMFRDITPPFLLVLQEWLVTAIHVETTRS